jgi:hypothetical protein
MADNGTLISASFYQCDMQWGFKFKLPRQLNKTHQYKRSCCPLRWTIDAVEKLLNKYPFQTAPLRQYTSAILRGTPSQSLIYVKAAAIGKV